MKVFLKNLAACVTRKGNLEHYRKFLIGNGHILVDTPEESDVTFVWTCGFRTDVRDNSIEQLNMYKKEYNIKVLAGGCIPTISPDFLRDKFDGEILKWQDDANLMEGYFGKKKRFGEMDTIFVEEPVSDEKGVHIKEPSKDIKFMDRFIKLVVSEGCTFKCTYCSERLAFPPMHSFKADNLVRVLEKILTKTDSRTVILIADSLGEWGKDFGSSLPELLKTLKAVDSNLTFLLNNINIQNFMGYYDAMFRFIEDGWIHHINLPIQSASDRILTAMKRGYSRADIDKVFSHFNEMGFNNFDTHMIVGFPGEEEADVKETIAFIVKHRPTYVLLNMYMDTLGAAASHFLEKVPIGVAKKRIIMAEKAIKEAGITCSSENGEIIQLRFEQMNRCC